MNQADSRLGVAEFSAMDRSLRLRAVRQSIAEASCDALIVTKSQNVRWLTGFTGSNGTAVVTGDGLTLVTDGRYTTQAEAELSEAKVEADVIISRELLGSLQKSMGPSKRVGLESEDISWAQQRLIEEGLHDRELVATAGLVEQLRKVKDAGEIDRLRHAAKITDQALADVRSELSQGCSERQIAQLLEQGMRQLGADDVSFPTIVASGPNSALPHASPTDRTIETGDLVIIDVGARVDGYGSDMTRTFMIGSSTSEQSDLYRAVARAQAAGLSAVRHGVDAKTVDDVCRQSLAEDSLDAAFIHGAGHGIGLEIHENPILSARTEETIQTGYVITVEPGAYLPEIGGVRVEDSVIVTATGCTPITKSPKDPLVT